VWDENFGDRRTELVCIGRIDDPGAASTQLAACLLTDEEMEAGMALEGELEDPYAPAWMAAMGQLPAGHHASDHADHGGGILDRLLQQNMGEKLADGTREVDERMAALEIGLHGIMQVAGEQGMPPDKVFGFVFDSLLDEQARHL
jgi:hypothetical protein